MLLAENIRHFRKRSGWTQQELADRLGVHRSMVGAYEEGRAEPRLSTVMQLCQLFSVEVGDLLMRPAGSARQLAADVRGSSLRVLPVLVDREQQDEQIAIVPVRAAAGYLEGYCDTTYMGRLPSFHLPVAELGAKRSYRIFQIQGDSMLPVPSGAYIISEYVQDWRSVRDYQPCIVVSRDEGVVYKRVVAHWEQSELELRSDNAEYAPYRIGVGQVLEVWKALGYLSFQLPEPFMQPTAQLQQLVAALRTEVDRLKGSPNR